MAPLLFRNFSKNQSILVCVPNIVNLTKTNILTTFIAKRHDVISQKNENPMTIDDGCLCKTAFQLSITAPTNQQTLLQEGKTQGRTICSASSVWAEQAPSIDQIYKK